MRKVFTLIVLFALMLPGVVRAQDKARLRQCVAALDTVREDTTRAVMLNEIGWDTSYEDLAVGLTYAERSLELSKKIGFNHGMMLANNTIGTIYTDMGEYDKALQSLHDCLSLAEKDGNLYSQATSYLNISIVYKEMGDKQKALAAALESQKIYQKMELKKGLCVVSNNVGSSYLDLDSVQKAIEFFSLSLRLSRELKNPDFESHALSGLSECFVETGDSVTAEKYILRSIAIMDSLHDDYDRAQGIYDYGNLLAHYNRFPEAEAKYNEALQLFRKIGMTDEEKSVWESFSELYEKEKDPVRALGALKKYMHLKDSLLNEKVLQHQHELETLYETEKKQNQIDNLTKEQTIQDTYMAALVAGVVLLVIILLILFNRNKLRRRTNLQLEKQNAIIEEKNKDITDSINYARKIQEAILPLPQGLNEQFSDAFVFYLPKDIVSGDFWWFSAGEEEFILAVGDCTGHGVPGGFMSVMGASFLSEIINEKRLTAPDQILNTLRHKVVNALKHSNVDAGEIRDGMDIVVCNFSKNNRMLSFAAANNPLWIARKGSVIEFPADKFPVGPHHDVVRDFSLQQADLQPGDMIYLFTDGYADQFGGNDGKKFKYRRLKDLFASVSGLSCSEQHKVLLSEFEKWKGSLEQVDDVLVVGLRV
ncbi:MAG TPA: tetratricopeptide repeat protein [Bacteroidia bacterium]|nr:tetratricopeptide repeat protein [Bacteroidia bacterium]